MQQIADWLEKLRMSEYATRFVENDIDFTILGELTDQDLKDLGVVSLGHRRKLLRAITELNGLAGCAVRFQRIAACIGPIAPEPLPVLFVGIVVAQLLAGRAAIHVLVAEIDKVLFAEAPPCFQT
jgi:hypothetical protein